MEVVNVSVWIPIITLVVGIFLKGVFDAWMENKKTNFERESRMEKRKEIILLQRIESQRKALGELQVALADLMRSTTKLHRYDLKQHKEQGYWDRESAPEELTEKSRDNFRAVTLIKVRIGSGKLRDLTSKLTLLCAGLPHTDSPEVAAENYDASTILYSKLNKKIGKALIALEREEQALFQ
ncbi:hypothetical protein C0J26_23780 [Pseudomonas baetica]|uniref:hypothetical protein n=1 Tax=Pseudomonas baetica TaxID=674054 RepID=UPI000C2C9D65|nr:hypothetical protein [Pseudomonas baetica]PTC16971.1 hypothetical protein C0J26_23780 [Pseudomonas baetica]